MQIFFEIDGGSPAAEAVETTFDVLQLIAGLAIGFIAGFLVAFILLALLRIFPARNPQLRPVYSATSKKIVVLLSLIGAWTGADYSLSRLESAAAPNWLGKIDHIFLILIILATTWLIVGMVNGVVGIIHAAIRQSSARRAKRVQTQTQILQRVIVVGIWLLGIAGVLLTFPGARAAGASVLASAGVVSVVAGLAAQTTLSNVFAGLQLAFSDSLRVGDIVYYQGAYTSVEEITLTYVVLEVWDGRRIIVPSTKMVTEPFENWTRRAPEMTGEVIWEVDWDLPITAARKQLEYLLSQTDLWNGKTGILQIKAAENYRLRMRAVVSAKDSATLTDLQNYVREKMVQWIQEEAPQAIPHIRKCGGNAADFQAAQEKTLRKMAARLDKEKPVLYLPADQGQVAEILQSDEERTVTLSLADIEDFSESAENGVLSDSGIDKTQVMPKITAELAGEVPGKSSKATKGAGKSVGKSANADKGADEGAGADIAKGGEQHTAKSASADTAVNSGVLLAADGSALTGQQEKISTAVREGHEASLFTGSIAAEARRKNFSGKREGEDEDEVEEVENAAGGKAANIAAADVAEVSDAPAGSRSEKDGNKTAEN